jgi:hypothetical protein
LPETWVGGNVVDVEVDVVVDVVVGTVELVEVVGFAVVLVEEPAEVVPHAEAPMPTATAARTASNLHTLRGYLRRPAGTRSDTYFEEGGVAPWAAKVQILCSQGRGGVICS